MRGHWSRRDLREVQRLERARRAIAGFAERWAMRRFVARILRDQIGKKREAAIRLQASIRRGTARDIMAGKKRVMLAIVNVQRVWRGHRGRHFYLRELSRQWRGALPLQAAARRRLVRPYVLRLRTEDAAEKLRRVLHMRQARTEYAASLLHTWHTNAARHLQRWVRQALAVENLQEAWEREGRFHSSLSAILQGLWGKQEEQCQVAVDSMERAGRTLLRTFRGHLGRKACAKARASVRLKAAVRRTVRASEHAEKVDAARRMGGVVRRVGCHSLEQRQRAVRGLEPVLWRAVVQQRLCEVRDAAAHARIDVDPEAVIALRMDLVEMRHRGKGWEDGDSFSLRVSQILGGLWGSSDTECTVAAQKRQRAAMRLQQCYRGHQGRGRFVRAKAGQVLSSVARRLVEHGEHARRRAALSVQRVWRGHFLGREECKRQIARIRLGRYVTALAGRTEGARIHTSIEGLQASARRSIAFQRMQRVNAAASALAVRLKARGEREGWMELRDQRWLAGRIGHERAMHVRGEGGFAAQLAAIVAGLGEGKVDREVGAATQLQGVVRRRLEGTTMREMRTAVEILEGGVRRAVMQERLLELRGGDGGYTVRVSNILGGLANLDLSLREDGGEGVSDELSVDFRDLQDRESGEWEKAHLPWQMTQSSRSLLEHAQQLVAATAFEGQSAPAIT